MSRGIKFRAWHETDKCWYNPRFIEMNLLGQAMLRGAEGLFEIIPASAVEQYTGLKDKNGKEIYEGDIVKVGNLRPTFKVAYNTPCAKFWMENNGLVEEFEDWDEETGIEVIGNIHENPELLEDK